MLRGSVPDASSIDLHRYLSLGQVSGFEEHVPPPPPAPSGLSTRAQLNLRPADVPISQSNGSKVMLRAHAADARYWRPQTTGDARSSNSRPADAIRNKGEATHRVVQNGGAAAVLEERPRSAAAVSYMDSAAILEAMKQDKILWARVHSPSPAAITEEKSKKISIATAPSRRLPGSSSKEPQLLPATSFSTGLDVSVPSSPLPLPPNDIKQLRAQPLSPRASANDQLMSPSTGGSIVKGSPAFSASKAQLSSHGGLMSFLALERKWPQQQQQQHDPEKPSVQQQATNPRSPLKSTVVRDAQALHSSASLATRSASKVNASPQSVQFHESSSLESRGVSSTNSPGTISTGLRRLMLEYARACFTCFLL